MTTSSQAIEASDDELSFYTALDHRRKFLHELGFVLAHEDMRSAALRHRQTDRQTDRHTHRQTHRQQTHRHTQTRQTDTGRIQTSCDGCMQSPNDVEVDKAAEGGKPTCAVMKRGRSVRHNEPDPLTRGDMNGGVIAAFIDP